MATDFQKDCEPSEFSTIYFWVPKSERTRFRRLMTHLGQTGLDRGYFMKRR